MNTPHFHERAPLVPFSLIFVSGIAIQRFLPVPVEFLVGFALFMTLLIWLSALSKVFLPSVWILTFLCGMFRLSNVEERRGRIADNLERFNEKEVQLVGEVRSSKRTQRGFKYLIVNHSIVIDTTAWSRRVKFHLYSDEERPLVIGSEIQAIGKFRTLRKPRNPGEFNFKSFYERQNIWGELFQDRHAPIAVIDTGRYSTFLLIDDIRQSVKSLFDRFVGGGAGNLMSALIVGLREEIPTRIKQDFADTGVIHVLAVSGLHVGYVLIIFTTLVKVFRIPYRWDKIAVVVALIVFAVLTGGKGSVWRASIMASLYVIAPLFHREGNLWNILAATALGLLIFNPYYLFDLGFLLSFSAVISIVFFYNQFERILPEGLRVSTIENPLARYSLALFIVSLSAQIGTLPFTWAFFNRIPVVSLVANVIIVPAIGILVGVGFAILFLGSWIPYVGWLLGNSAWFLSQLVFWVARHFAKLPFAYVEVGAPSILNVTQYAGLVVTIFLLVRRQRWRLGLVTGVATLNLIVWPWAVEPPTLDVIFLDVGQGDAALVRIPSSPLGRSKTILIDAGMKNFRKDMGKRVVLPVAKHLGVKRIDLLVMSHPHSDHIGGVETVLNNIPVGEVWDPFSDYRSTLYEQTRKVVLQDSISYRKMGAGEWEKGFSPAQIYVLHPDSLFAVNQNNLNDISLVIKLVYGDVSFLFVGDLEEKGEEEMLFFGEFNRATVLKVGHHASSTASTQPFLDLVMPQYAVISVGERNTFGFPSEEVISRLEASGCIVYRTDREGAIWLESDGKGVWQHGW